MESEFVILPEWFKEEQYAKMVQLYIRNEPKLIINRGEHAEIAQKYLEQQEIDWRTSCGEWIHARYRPSRNGGDIYRIVGAGIAKLNNGNVITLDGISEGYGLSPSLEHAQDINQRQTDWILQYTPITRESLPPSPQTDWDHDEPPF